MPVCYIVGAGPYSGKPFTPKDGDYVIAADGGYGFIIKHNLRCDLLVGDFDSSDMPDFENTVKLSPVKDDTDTIHAVKEGLARGYDDFRIYGALGGRFAHSFASVQTLSYILDRGGRAYLIGDGIAATVIRNSRLDFRKECKGYFSVFSLSEVSRGVYIEGGKYPLCDHTLTNSFPLGVSNEFTGVRTAISVCEGELLIMFECDDLEKEVYQC